MTRRVFVQLCLLCQLGPAYTHPCPNHIQIGLLHYALHGAVFEEYLEASLVQNVAA